MGMENPFIAIRKEKVLTVSQEAMIFGVSDMTIRRIENGIARTISPIVLNSLEKWGYDKKQIQSDYEQWKAYRIRQLENNIL